MLIDENLYRAILEKKAALDRFRPFDRHSLESLKEAFKVEMTYNSNAIEGNTLSLSETRMVLEDGITIGGKSMREHLEVINHAKAMDFIESLVRKPKIEENDVLSIHAFILDRIDPENAGFYRGCSVLISGTRYVPPSPSKVPEMMKEVYHLLNSKGEPIEMASRIHQRFVSIHPFIDGNGRAARLLINLYLMRNNFLPIIFLKAERKKYIDDIVKEQINGDPKPFADFTAKAMIRSLDTYLNTLGRRKNYISLKEASKHSKHSQEYLSLLARQGKLDAMKDGRNWKTTKEAVEKYERSNLK